MRSNKSHRKTTLTNVFHFDGGTIKHHNRQKISNFTTKCKTFTNTVHLSNNIEVVNLAASQDEPVLLPPSLKPTL